MPRKPRKYGSAECAGRAVQMAMAAGAGIGFSEIALSLADGCPPGEARRLEKASDDIRNGAYPDEALAGTGLFPAYFTDMLGAGISSGKAPETLRALSAYYSRMASLEASLKRAASQPLAMAAMSLAVFLAVAIKVLPVFEDVYRSIGMSPNGATAALTALGRHVSAYWAAYACGSAGALCAAAGLALSEKGRALAAGIFARSRTGRAMADAKFAQALAMGLESGMDPAEASAMARDVAGGGERYRKCAGAVKSGTAVSEAMKSAGIGNAAQLRILDAGAKTGTLPEAMGYVAGEMGDAADGRLRALADRIEPAVTVIGSLLTGGTVVLSMLPLLDVMRSVG